MTEKSFDIAILGGGPGGYTAAIRAAQLGMTVALIEKEFLGGTCLNRGCIPSKAFIRCASLLEEIKSSKTFGISVSEVSFDWTKILKYKDRCVVRLRKGTESLMQKNKIEVFSSNGVLSSVDTIQTDEISIKAKNIILATGSVPRSLPSLTVDGVFVINSDHALELSSLPKSLLIVGAGAIGCEFAYVMSTLGVDVTIVEFLDRALPMEDEEISKEYEAELKRRKIKLFVRSS
ncbi:MAG: FAD-dependent oxidoreductase, partial [bacterium]